MTIQTKTLPAELADQELRRAAGGAAYMKLGDIKGDVSSPAKLSCQNNLRQLGLAAH